MLLSFFTISLSHFRSFHSIFVTLPDVRIPPPHPQTLSSRCNYPHKSPPQHLHDLQIVANLYISYTPSAILPILQCDHLYLRNSFLHFRPKNFISFLITWAQMSLTVVCELSWDDSVALSYTVMSRALCVSPQLYQSQLSALYCLSMHLHNWGEVK